MRNQHVHSFCFLFCFKFFGTETCSWKILEHNDAHSSFKSTKQPHTPCKVHNTLTLVVSLRGNSDNISKPLMAFRSCHDVAPRGSFRVSVTKSAMISGMIKCKRYAKGMQLVLTFLSYLFVESGSNFTEFDFSASWHRCPRAKGRLTLKDQIFSFCMSFLVLIFHLENFQTWSWVITNEKWPWRPQILELQELARVEWYVLVSYQFEFRLIDSIRMWGDSMLEMKQWVSPWFPLQFVSSRYIHLHYLYLNFRKLQQALLVENSLTSNHFLELFGDPKHGWVFLIVYTNPLTSMFLNSRSNAVNSPFLSFPFEPIPCRSCAKRRTTDDENGGDSFFWR